MGGDPAAEPHTPHPVTPFDKVHGWRTRCWWIACDMGKWTWAWTSELGSEPTLSISSWVTSGKCLTALGPRFLLHKIEIISSSRASLVTQMVKNLPAMWETWVWFLGWEDPLEEGMAPTPVFLPGESHGQRSLAGYSPWGHKESDMTEWLSTGVARKTTLGNMYMVPEIVSSPWLEAQEAMVNITIILILATIPKITNKN